MLLGCTRNEVFFHGHIEGRDTKNFGPGEYLVIRMPGIISYWMGSNNGIPVIDIADSVHNVNIDCLPPHALPACPHQLVCERQHAFSTLISTLR